MADGALFGPEAVKQLKKLFHDFYGEIKNPGGQPKRGNVSIGLSAHVVKLKSTISARSGTAMGEGEVYLCETNSDGTITATTIVKTAWNEGPNTITLSTSQDTYLQVKQTNYGNFMVQPPATTANKCRSFDGVLFSDISGFSSGSVQYLSHSTGTTNGVCLAWVSGSTCT